jgi:hypothetical protein
MSGDGYGGGVESIATMKDVVNAVSEKACVMMSTNRDTSFWESDGMGFATGVEGEDDMVATLLVTLPAPLRTFCSSTVAKQNGAATCQKVNLINESE